MSPIARAAALGLMLGALSACASKAGSPPAAPPQTIVVPAGKPADDEPTGQSEVVAMPEREGARSCCAGKNDCKGLGRCRVEGSHACSGMNQCKARGGCKGNSCVEAAEGKSCCRAMNDCKGKGSCKTDVNDCMGKNECKGKGGCSAHCPR